jgi:dipeptidyl aminopeptidase/acylaminoacyl peptidase
LLRCTAFVSALLAGCSLQRPAPPPKTFPIQIVAAEVGATGLRLIALDETGNRQFELVTPAAEAARDSYPAVSPDGRWVVFASTRDRATGTSLWIAPLRGTPEVAPRRLTTEAAVDQHPIWARDGRSIVFASTRDGGDFDLWQLAMADGVPGPITQLTRGDGHEVMPTIGPEGTLVYAEITQQAGLEVESHLEERAADGSIRKLTAGPADTSPSISPDGTSLIFVRPALHGDQPQAELWRIDRSAWRSSGDELSATRVVALPITDESGPVWSRDGRFVFATSVLRGHRGKPVFSAIIHVDLQEQPAHARILIDRAGAAVRLTPAIRAERLDISALRSDPEYLPELARIMSKLITEQQEHLE